jgi:hypothetical protein
VRRAAGHVSGGVDEGVECLVQGANRSNLPPRENDGSTLSRNSRNPRISIP